MMKKIKMSLLVWCTMLLPVSKSSAFCGFYVAKADAKLFNKTSQIIFVRDGDRSIVTMSSDFQGDVKDFAMVVPVPEVLTQESIRIADRSIFDKLDAYSGPRLVEYYDADPCASMLCNTTSKMKMSEIPMATDMAEDLKMNKDGSVTIEASYTVGEYDILILSATESDGLKRWLIANDYKIPETANHVLDPYIRNNMKFFVVKVNLENQKRFGFNNLRPIQIAFNTNKFMLPIRLGMANATEAQDMIVYGFSKNGRIETTNYRTVKVPSNRNIPEFVQPKFGMFYKDLFDRAHKREGENAVFLEYAWDVSFNNPVKCDPCVGPPPMYNDLREAGVYWLQNNGGTAVNGSVYFTRLHVRYDQQHFPQDLFFQETPNKQRFQGRYVMNHAIQYNLTCEEADGYYRKVSNRRRKELKELVALTGWDINQHRDYVNIFANKVTKNKNDDTEWFNNDTFKKNFLLPMFGNEDNHTPTPGNGSPFAQIISGLVILSMSGLLWWKKRVNMIATA